ncbi:hypothetical protein SAMN04487867_104159 [Vreelandella titanicae]|uniref:hypothetical protein n=1 Tax=Vreelandella titanicae TaxID=664683 RepID=UPI0008832EAE|nr:hypothetical protein [Halomonas titanicae]SDI29849.1 hypothetical protein SAMN04487867_104159 [Halomonas titanicae]
MSYQIAVKDDDGELDFVTPVLKGARPRPLSNKPRPVIEHYDFFLSTRDPVFFVSPDKFRDRKAGRDYYIQGEDGFRILSELPDPD